MRDPLGPDLTDGARPLVDALVIAGGAARRFGSDKTSAVVGGVAILERVVRAARPLVSSTTVIGPWAPAGCERIIEPQPREGPLVALAFGLGRVAGEYVLVLGGDHPFLVSDLLAMIVGRSVALGDRADAVVPVRDGRPEPLVACYRTAPVARIAARLVAGGERRLGALVEGLEVVALDEEMWRRVDPSGMSFRDIDTPEDLARAQGDADRYS